MVEHPHNRTGGSGGCTAPAAVQDFFDDLRGEGKVPVAQLPGPLGLPGLDRLQQRTVLEHRHGVGGLLGALGRGTLGRR